MKEFWQVIRRYVAPYRGYVGGSVAMTLLSAVLNVFSFSLIIPILQILFNINQMQYSFIAWEDAGTGLKEKVINNLYYYVTQAMDTAGPSRVLLVLCLALVGLTFIKTASFFGASAKI